MSTKQQPARRGAKAGLDADAARRKREENVIELRKNKRDENLQKRRQTAAGMAQVAQDGTTDSTKGAGAPVRRQAMRTWARNIPHPAPRGGSLLCLLCKLPAWITPHNKHNFT